MVIFGGGRGITRFSAYGFLLLIILASFYFAGVPGRNALFIMGALELGNGLFLLISFIRKQPLRSGEVNSAVQ